ncbi:MAG: TolC family protein [Candidatus Latescibacterota bacterium]
MRGNPRAPQAAREHDDRRHPRRSASITAVLLAGALVQSPVAQEVTPSATESPGTRVLSLADAQARALEVNQILQVARAGVDQARAARLQTWAGHLPSIDLSQRAIRTNDAVSAFGFGLKQERFDPSSLAVPGALVQPDAATDYQTVVELRQPVWNGGQELHARRQAGAGLRLAQARLRRTEEQIRLQTAEAYWGLVLARQALEAVRHSLATARAHADAARAHYEEETAPLSDLLAAQVRVAELRGQEIDAVDRVAAAVDGLSLVTGLETGIELVPADTLGEPAITMELKELIDAALAEHAELEAADQTTAAARHAVGVARADFLPHLNAFGQVDLDSDAPFERQGESWTVGVAATWNLFAGLRSTGAVGQARAQLTQAQAQRAFLEAQLARQIAQAWRAVHSAQAQVAIAGEAVAQADERLRMTGLQYQEELVAAVDLLDAETALTQTRLRRLQALHGLNVGMARLEFAAGLPVQ